MLGRLYYAIKLRIDALADILIHRSEMALETSTRPQNPLLRQTITACASATANLCHLVKQLPRLDAVRVTGTLGSLIYVGEHDGHAIGLFETLFPEGYEQADLGRIPLWKLPAQTQMWLQENDLVICRVSQFFPWRIPATYAFDSPLRVWQILPLDKPLDQLLAGGNKADLRWRVNRMLKQNFTYRVSRSPQDLEFFYHRMVIPTAQERHQRRAMIPTYEYFEYLLKTDYLMFFSLDGEEVAGTINHAQNDVFRGRFLGLLDGNTDLMKREIYTAIYWYSIEHACNQGLQKMSFEDSIACTSNGVFDYKSRWGAKVHPFPNEYDQLLFRAERLSDEWRERLNDIGFITRHNDQHLRVFIDQVTPSPDDARDQAVRHGLDGIQVVTPHQHHNHLNDAPQALSKQTG